MGCVAGVCRVRAETSICQSGVPLLSVFNIGTGALFFDGKGTATGGGVPGQPVPIPYSMYLQDNSIQKSKLRPLSGHNYFSMRNARMDSTRIFKSTSIIKCVAKCLSLV